jgi:hypothetical protein
LEWRADGSAFGRKGNIDAYGTSVGHDYTRCPEDKTALPSSSTSSFSNGGNGGCPLDEDTVNDLLAKRLDAKLRRDFELADAIRDDLTAAGVKVEDRLKLWRAGMDDGWGLLLEGVVVLLRRASGNGGGGSGDNSGLVVLVTAS